MRGPLTCLGCHQADAQAFELGLDGGIKHFVADGDTHTADQARVDIDARFQFETAEFFGEAVDKELIGGVKVVIGDEVIDGSVRGRLATMAAALQK